MTEKKCNRWLVVAPAVPLVVARPDRVEGKA